MQLTLTMNDQAFTALDLGETVQDALRNSATQARARRDSFRKTCEEFETKYGMDSDTFWKRFEAGELGDEADYFDWYAARRGADLWEKRFRILTQVRV